MSQTKTQLVEGLNINTSAPADALAVDNNGRVGIGTSAPSTLLHLSSATGSATPTPTELRIATTTNASDWSTTDPWGRLSFYSGDSSAGGPKIHAAITATAINTSASTSDIGFWTNAGGSDTLFQAMTIKGSSAFVGIGTASPNASLHIANSGPVLRLEDTDTNGYAQVLCDNNGSLYLDADAGNSQGSSSIRFRVDLDEKARIDSAGRLLVGTSTARSNDLFGSSHFQLEGTGSTDTSIQLTRNSANTGAGGIAFCKSRAASNGGVTVVQSGDVLGFLDFQGADGTDFARAATIEAQVDGTPGNNDMPGRLVFSTTADGASSPTERMRIKSTGTVQVGNGTLGLTGTLVVDPSSNTAGYPITVNNPSGGTTNEAVIDIYRQGTRTGYITNTPTATYFTSVSDYRAKENVTAITDGIARLQQLKPSYYNFIIAPDKTIDGFIAHEVQDVVPEAVVGEKDAIDADGKPVYQSIDLSRLVPMLTAALQEAVTRIETLEAEVAALKGA